MSGPRYSILPHEFFADTRPLMAHVRVMGVLGRHSNETGWCRLKQSTVASEAEISRETVCRALSDLEGWGYVEKAKGKGRSLCYRVVMDSKKAPPDDLEEEVVHIGGQKTKCDVGITSAVTSTVTSDVTQQITSDVTYDVTPNKRPSLTSPIERKGSEDSNFDLKVKSSAVYEITPDSPSKWRAWQEWFSTHSPGSIAKANAAGKILASSYWPDAGVTYGFPQAATLTERSLAMTGEAS